MVADVRETKSLGYVCVHQVNLRLLGCGHAVHVTEMVLDVSLVHPSPADDEAVAALRSHPGTLRYLNFLPEYCSVEDSCKRREERTADPRTRDFHIHHLHGQSGVEHSATPSFVGTCGLTDINPVNCSAEAGILIVPELHRTGLGTQALYLLLNFAFDGLKLHRVVFETGEDNVAMRGWFEHVLEIKPESYLKEAWKRGDGWMDAVVYRILEYEWREGLKHRLENRITV
jgi:RimJ/RimL family protein N-acetyltransferase